MCFELHREIDATISLQRNRTVKSSLTFSIQNLRKLREQNNTYYTSNTYYIVNKYYLANKYYAPIKYH